MTASRRRMLLNCTHNSHFEKMPYMGDLAVAHMKNSVFSTCLSQLNDYDVQECYDNGWKYVVVTYQTNSKTFEIYLSVDPLLTTDRGIILATEKSCILEFGVDFKDPYEIPAFNTSQTSAILRINNMSSSVFLTGIVSNVKQKIFKNTPKGLDSIVFTNEDLYLCDASVINDNIVYSTTEDFENLWQSESNNPDYPCKAILTFGDTKKYVESKSELVASGNDVFSTYPRIVNGQLESDGNFLGNIAFVNGVRYQDVGLGIVAKVQTNHNIRKLAYKVMT